MKNFNLAIQTGIYPDELKIAKVIPIFKSGDTTECTNYRPISVLSIIDNIFERILKKRMVEYLEKFNILYEYQFGFREGHSTTHALVEIIDNIKESIDKNNMTCGIFVDLSKAFETVNHHILLAKLENYGFRGKAYELLSSYLSNRKQYVQLNDHKSSYKPISCGVPQGSVLGPLLFLIYINDIANCCPQEKTRIYADDTNIFFDSNNVDDISERAHQIMVQLDKWFIANKLTLNAKKSSFTIFRSLRSKTKNLPDKLVFNKSEIIRSATVTYLGVLLDEHLTFKNHVQKVCNSIKMYFKVFYNIRRYISSKQIEILYYSLIYSRIKYGITVYGYSSKTNMQKIQTLQNQILKVLSNEHFRFPTKDIHNRYNLLLVKDIFYQEKLTFVFNYTNNNLPVVFDNYYTYFSDVHGISTRYAHEKCILPSCNTNLGLNSQRVNGAQLWNELDSSFKVCSNVKMFRSSIKNKILLYK